MFWQTLLLLLIVGGSGTAVYLQSVRNIFSQIDTELLSGARVIEGTLRAFVEPPAESELGRRPRGGRGGRGRRGPPPGDSRVFTSVDIPPRMLQLPREMMMGPPQNRPYFTVFDSKGRVIQQTPRSKASFPERGGGESTFQLNGNNREVVVRAPGRTVIVVGQGAARQRAAINRLALTLVVSGTAVMAIGLVGAWWLTGRAIKPIKSLSDTAESITAANLKNRINVEKLDTEFKSVSTTINAMLDRLANAIEKQRQFTADASHELRTPISILNMHAELALSKQRSEAEYRKSLETCLHAGNRMNNLTEDLLELARSDSGQMSAKHQEVDLLETAKESVSFFEVLANKRQIKIEIHGENVHCTGDPQRLRQLIDNLLKNAIVHNEDGGRVQVSISHHEGQAIVKVANTGLAIPPEHLPHLFDRFYRVDAARQRQSDLNGGSGLGLAICKTIADDHNATLAITSDEKDGTVVTFAINAIRA